MYLGIRYSRSVTCCYHESRIGTGSIKVSPNR